MFFDKGYKVINLTTQDLDKMAVKSNKKIGALGTDLVDIKIEIGKLQGKKVQMERDLKSEQDKLGATREAQVINSGVPKEILRLRIKLLVDIERSRSDKITIATKERLDREIYTAKKELGLVCKHPFVFHKNGYEGSPSQDYENGRPSIRYCVICNFEERAKNLKQDAYRCVANDFEILGDVENRMVLSEPYRQYPESLSKIDIWVHIAVALKPFEDCAVRALSSKTSPDTV